MSEHQSQFFGRNTGHPFFLYPVSPSTVRVLEVWSGRASGDSEGLWVTKGIKLTWFNGEQKMIYNRPQDDDQYTRYEFVNDESADWSVRAGWRIDRIEFRTSSGSFWSAGGTAGTLHSHVANGFLIGFEGSAGWEMDFISY
ncbi:hypothetical protein BBP40_002215 [Aspergillus hancockii]|nr:hypothetical protein BBP40_002215 [Aspergillus hancockii]